jgi:hypothetical protein
MIVRAVAVSWQLVTWWWPAIACRSLAAIRDSAQWPADSRGYRRLGAIYGRRTAAASLHVAEYNCTTINVGAMKEEQQMCNEEYFTI